MYPGAHAAQNPDKLAATPVEVKQRMIDWWGPILAEYYAGTEADGMTVIDSRTWLTKPGTVGRAALGVLHICEDGTGTELPVGEIGLVHFERDTLPFTYHNDPDRTAAAQHPDHPTWTALGDIGHLVQPAAGVEAGPALEQEISAFVKSRIAHDKAPRSVRFVDDLPRTETGELVKGDLRKLYA